MRPVIVQEFLSLDGVMQGPGDASEFPGGGWQRQFVGDDHNAIILTQFVDADALLLGRKTYERFAAVWPTIRDEIGFADRINAMVKYVASSTLREVTWNATLLHGDVADAVLAALDRADAAGKVFELGGPRVLSMREVAAYILQETGREKRLIAMPMALLRLNAFFLERLPGKLLTRDQLKLLEHDNVVAPGAAGLAALGVVPTPIELEVPAYLRRFRPGGGVREILA